MCELKCKLSECGKFVEPCDGLGKLIEFGNPIGVRKGIFMWQYYDTGTGGKTRQMVGVKSGESKAKGMIFNFCPICGEKTLPTPPKGD